jgi:microcystin degradation protein MlrC
MRELEDAARGLTVGPIIEVGVFGGFPYADTRDTGASILVVADTRRDANGAVSARVTAEMSDLIHRLAPAFAVTLLSPEQAIAHALASTQPGLIAITDPADNPLSGGACDTPGLLRALLAAQVAVPTVFASFADAEVVAAAEQAGVGRSIEVTLGGRYGAHFGAPVQLRARVERVTDGVFRNTGPMSTGVERRCGGSTVLVVTGQANLRIVVTSEVVPADDPAFYALHRIEAQDVRLLCVKAKNHFRAGMGAACSEIIDCDAPGPACADLTQLPFRNLRHSAASA